MRRRLQTALSEARLALLRGQNAGGGSGSASSNYESDDVPNPTPSTNSVGTLLTTAITITPRVSGNLKISWSASGVCSADNTLLVWTLMVGGSPEQVISSAPGGDAAHTTTAGSTVIAAGQPIGTPVTVQVGWTATGGTMKLNASQGGIVVEELPVQV